MKYQWPDAGRDRFDLAADFAVPLPMIVIAEMLGVPAEDRPRIARWNDVLLRMSYLVADSPQAGDVFREFGVITQEMSEYLAALLAERHARSQRMTISPG